MWEIITLVYRALASDDVMVLLKKLLKKAGVEIDEKALASGIVDINKWSNPKTLVNALKNASKSDIKDTMEKINALNKEQQNQKQLDKSDMEKISNDTSWTSLQSSWIQFGSWQVTNQKQQTGNLTIIIQSDKSPKWYGPYTYPSVPLEVWVAMKNAKGANGSGAGTMFWRYWLRKWLPSRLRVYVKEKLAKEKGIMVGGQRVRRPRPNTKAIIEARNYIFGLEKRFTQTKYGKTQDDLGTRAWKQNRAKEIYNRYEPYRQRIEGLRQKKQELQSKVRKIQTLQNTMRKIRRLK